MSHPPQVRAVKFGTWLELQRTSGKPPRSLEQIARQLRPLVEQAGLKVDRSLVQKIEDGRVPNWPLVIAFSRVYDVPLQEIVMRLVDALEFPGANDLLRHTSDQKREPQMTGGSDAPSVGVLEQLANAEKTLREMRIAAGRIAAIAAKQITRAEDYRTRTAQPGRSARRRGTG